MSLLDKLKDEVAKCTLCAVLVENRTQTVFGDGTIQAEVMFVGEAPGVDEDEKGIPFVGRAGQLLNKVMSKAGIPREMVYIANVLKCRPPENRDPQDDEIENCSHFLAAQIAIIKPKVICPLGRFGLEQIIGKEYKISQAHGKTFRRKDGTVFMPMYHPAYYLRNANSIDEYEKDFRRLKRLLVKEGVNF
jgi:DNA polymerase